MELTSKFIRSGLAAIMLSPLAVNAASISYYLDQTNLDPASGTGLIDGTNFLLVTIDDEGAAGDIKFTVKTLSPLNDIGGTNFGIQSFSFNTLLDTTLYDETNDFSGLPSGWSTNVIPPTNQEDGFGMFDISVSDGGFARTDLLTFSISNINFDTITDYIEGSLNNGGALPPQGSVFFSAHVAGFDDGFDNNSAFFGGITPIPLPPAMILLASALGGLVVVSRKKKAAC